MAVAATPTKKAEGFFDLPRELRDEIYDLLRPEEENEIDEWIWRFEASIPALRLVSPQFKTEHDERILAKGQLLRLENVQFPEQRSPLNIHLPGLALESSRMEVSLELGNCCTCLGHGWCVDDHTLPQRIELLRSLQGLFSRLESVRISVKCSCVFFECSSIFSNHLDLLAGLPKLTHLDITFSTSRFLGWQSMAEVCVLRTTWSRESGFEHTKEEISELLRKDLPSRTR